MNPLTTALADHFGRSRRADPIRRNHASRIRPIHASKIPSNHATKIRPIDGSLWPSRDGSDRAVLDTCRRRRRHVATSPQLSSLFAATVATATATLTMTGAAVQVAPNVLSIA